MPFPGYCSECPIPWHPHQPMSAPGPFPALIAPCAPSSTPDTSDQSNVMGQSLGSFPPAPGLASTQAPSVPASGPSPVTQDTDTRSRSGPQAANSAPATPPTGTRGAFNAAGTTGVPLPPYANMQGWWDTGPPPLNASQMASGPGSLFNGTSLTLEDLSHSLFTVDSSPRFLPPASSLDYTSLPFLHSGAGFPFPEWSMNEPCAPAPWTGRSSPPILQMPLQSAGLGTDYPALQTPGWPGPCFDYPPFLNSSLPQAPGSRTTQGLEAKSKERKSTDRSLNKQGKENLCLKPADPKQSNLERIVGEIAFQLDRRILSYIFPDRVRLYGYTVSNIPEKISQGGNDPVCPLSQEQRGMMMNRFHDVMSQLRPKGYDPNFHSKFSEYIVNTYGILRERPDTTGPDGDVYNNITYLQQTIEQVVPADQKQDCLVLLNCLSYLSQADGKPLFIW